MRKKKLFIILFLSLLFISLLIFLLLGFLRGQNEVSKMMSPPIKINYPKVSDDKIYTERIFDTSYVHDVNIYISNSDWKDLTTYPAAKRMYHVDVTIDGIKISNVSFRTKGNSSLKTIAEGPDEGPGANRFSFKVDFGKYEDNQSYFGLDKISFNNIFGDASYLNDFVSYEMFRQLGVAAPLTSFVYIKINGENLGLYLAVEDIGNSFLERNNLDGYLYKPEQNHGDDNGASITYTDDDENSYRDIFNNAYSKITSDDKTRLISSIKQLNNNTNLDKVLNIDEIISYFVVHNFVLSYDSYTGESIHNYFLLEKDGIMSMIPWDYNLAFGRCDMAGDITTIVNYGIDSPIVGAEPNERPMWYWIEKNETYLNKYHSIMNKLITDYFESGKFDEYVDYNYNVIKSYIPLDFSAFYSAKEADTAVSTLKTFCKLRSQSIKLQLGGKLSTRTTTQLAQNKIDASSIKLEDMGFVALPSLKQDDDSDESNSNNKKKHSSNKSVTKNDNN